jgi:hypothetical protein
VGLGGTRASNFAVALTSNAGLLGAAFYFLFVLQTLLIRRAPQGDAEGHALLSAVRWSYLPPFFTSLMIGTTPDFGLFNAFLYGIAMAIAHKGPQRASRSADARLIDDASRHRRSRLVTERSVRAGH